METDKVSKSWKVLAIIFIILFAVETLGVAYLITTGLKIQDKQERCSINICGNLKADAYYDANDNTCYCYQGEEVIFQTLMP